MKYNEVSRRHWHGSKGRLRVRGQASTRLEARLDLYDFFSTISLLFLFHININGPNGHAIPHTQKLLFPPSKPATIETFPNPQHGPTNTLPRPPPPHHLPHTIRPPHPSSLIPPPNPHIHHLIQHPHLLSTRNSPSPPPRLRPHLPQRPLPHNILFPTQYLECANPLADPKHRYPCAGTRY